MVIGIYCDGGLETNQLTSRATEVFTWAETHFQHNQCRMGAVTYWHIRGKRY